MTGGLGYPDTAEQFTIEPVSDGDRDAIDTIFRNSPDGGEIEFAPRFEIDPYTIQKHTAPTADVHGLLARAPDGTPAGTGFIFIDTIRINGQERVGAHLSGLAVRPEYRGQGLGKRLVAERIGYALTQTGKDTELVVLASIQSGNDPSKAVAETWADGFPYEVLTASFPPLDSPKTRNFDIREPAAAEYADIAASTNDFYSDADLYVSQTVDTHTTTLESSPIDEPVAKYLVAEDNDELVAGTLVENMHKVSWMELVDLPDDMKEADELPPALPDSREVHPTILIYPWHRPGHRDALEALIEGVRADPDSGNRISMPIDPTGPLTDLHSDDEVAIEAQIAVRGADTSASEDSFAAVRY